MWLVEIEVLGFEPATSREVFLYFFPFSKLMLFLYYVLSICFHFTIIYKCWLLLCFMWCCPWLNVYLTPHGHFTFFYSHIIIFFDFTFITCLIHIYNKHIKHRILNQPVIISFIQTYKFKKLNAKNLRLKLS